MARQVTKEMVKMARKHLIEKGEYPSEEKILDFIGFGSATTVHKYNSEILREERAKVLQRGRDLPIEISEAWLSTLADGIDEGTAHLTTEIEEKERSLEAMIEKLNVASERNIELEKDLADLNSETERLREDWEKDGNDKDTEIRSLQGTLSVRDAKIKSLTMELEALREKHQRLNNLNGRLEETNRHLDEEKQRHLTESKQLQEDLNLEKLKVASLDSTLQALHETLEDKKQQISEASEEKRALIAQLSGFQHSLLSIKSPTKKASAARSKNSGNSQANA